MAFAQNAEECASVAWAQRCHEHPKRDECSLHDDLGKSRTRMVLILWSIPKLIHRSDSDYIAWRSFCSQASFSLHSFNHSDLNLTRFWCIVVPVSSLLLTMSGLCSFHVQWRTVYKYLSSKLLYTPRLRIEEILHQLVAGVFHVDPMFLLFQSCQ